MTTKSEYHYKKAKAILRKLEDEARIISKKEEHARLLAVADKHMEFYQMFQREELAPQRYQPPLYGGQYQQPLYGGITTNTLHDGHEYRTAEGDVVG